MVDHQFIYQAGVIMLMVTGLVVLYNQRVEQHEKSYPQSHLLLCDDTKWRYKMAIQNGDTKWQKTAGLRDFMRRIGYNEYQGLGLPDNAPEEFKWLTVQLEVNCTDWKIYGKIEHGFWPVCRAKDYLPQQPCTVYSFGINYDWTFDDAYRAAHNCIIRTFDPSMRKVKQHEHRPGVPFYPLGLSDSKETTKQGWRMDTYKGFLTRFNEQDKIIPYLKIDIEDYEWRVFANMLSDGVLVNVMQLSFEIHISRWKHVREYIDLFRGLHDLGFRRWYYKDHFNRKGDRFLYQCDQSYININFLRTI